MSLKFILILIATLKAVQSQWPTAKSTELVNNTIKVIDTYDGGLKRIEAGRGLTDGGQSGHQKPIFVVSDGATLKNVIIGCNGADGVHCRGSCALTNVWWEDVGEHAATFKGTSASHMMTVSGGGARKAADNVFEHNGGGTLRITNFEAEHFGKLYRSCDNCKQQFTRHVIVEGVVVRSPASIVVAINANLGDTAVIKDLSIIGLSDNITVCAKYDAVTDGEPRVVDSGHDGQHCIYSDSDVKFVSFGLSGFSSRYYETRAFIFIMAIFMNLF